MGTAVLYSPLRGSHLAKSSKHGCRLQRRHTCRLALSSPQRIAREAVRAPSWWLPTWILWIDVVVVVLVAALVLILPNVLSPDSRRGAGPDDAVTRVYRQSLPGVVQVVDYARSDADLVGATLGSGFVVDFEGHVLTNHHVIHDARSKGIGDLGVVLADGGCFRADLIGEDPTHDLAVLRVEAPRERLHPLALGHSSGLDVGQRVVAIGSPYGLRQSLSMGVVSFVGRRGGVSDGPFADGVIQTDAAINPGNSGGPLLDLDGNVVGIATAAMMREIAPYEVGSVGVSFAVPAEVARRLIPEMIGGGLMSHPWLGVYAQDSQPWLNSGQEAQASRGAMITHVLFGSPASEAGLRSAKYVHDPSGNSTLVEPGDVIVALDGMVVGSAKALASYVTDSGKRVGDVVTLRVVRGDDVLEVAVRLRARDESQNGAI